MAILCLLSHKSKLEDSGNVKKVGGDLSGKRKEDMFKK